MTVGLYSPIISDDKKAQPIVMGFTPLVYKGKATIAALENLQKKYPKLDLKGYISEVEESLGKSYEDDIKAYGQGDADKFAAAAVKGDLLDANAKVALSILGNKFNTFALKHPKAIKQKPIKWLCDFNAKVTGKLINRVYCTKALQRGFRDHMSFLNGCDTEFLRIKAKLKPRTIVEAQTRCNTAVDKCFAELAKWEAQAKDLNQAIPNYAWNKKDATRVILSR